MRRNNLFLGLLLLIVGVVLLLNALGLLPGNANAYIWPLVLVLVGLLMLLGPLTRQRSSSRIETLTVPLDGATQAGIRIEHGAGRLSLGSTSTPGVLLTGSFTDGAENDVRRSGNTVDVRLRALTANAFPPFFGVYENSWQVNLASGIPTRLELNTGANEARIDLTELAITDLILKTGASSTRVQLPAHAGLTRVEVSSGVASVDLSVPEGVAARIRATGGLAGIRVNTQRFPRVGDYYETPDFHTAQNRVEIHSETGVGSVEIH